MQYFMVYIIFLDLFRPSIQGSYSGLGTQLRQEDNVKYYTCNVYLSEPGSSDSIVSGYGLDDWAIEVQSLAKAKAFFL
jgi:hypothetical protein